MLALLLEWYFLSVCAKCVRSNYRTLNRERARTGRNWLIASFAIAFFVLVGFQEGTDKEDHWWFADKAQKNAEKLARKLGLKDTILHLACSDYHVWLPQKLDAKKPILVFVHGMGLNGIGQWKNQLKPFAGDFQLIIPDLVGYAGSSNPTHSFSPEIQAQAIYLTLTQLNIKQPVNLVGFSYGGLVVATFHDLYPEWTDRLAICNSPVKHFTKHMADSIVASRNLTHFEQLLSPRTKKEMHEFFDAVYGKSAPPLPSTIRKKASTFIFTTNADTKRKQIDHLEKFATSYVGKNYELNSTKVLLYWGKRDGVIPVEVGEKLHRDYPLARWVTHPKAKHDALMTFSKDYNRALLEHFKLP